MKYDYPLDSYKGWSKDLQYVKDGTLDEETFAKWTRLIGCGDLPLAGTWVSGHR